MSKHGDCNGVTDVVEERLVTTKASSWPCWRCLVFHSGGVVEDGTWFPSNDLVIPCHVREQVQKEGSVKVHLFRLLIDKGMKNRLLHNCKVVMLV